MEDKKRAPRNRTITLSDDERVRYRSRLLRLTEPVRDIAEILGQTIHQDLFDAVDKLPRAFADLIVVDPPYNLSKSFNSTSFKRRPEDDYVNWLELWFPKVCKMLRPTGSLYICCDWSSSRAVSAVAGKHLVIRNRITWEREKGRGALNNWKNCSEDIWFCTKSEDFFFDVDAVKLKRKVLAPYTTEAGLPKDWDESADGRFRLTAPSNLWTDISVPFWSMPENTDHPTQKPEKLVAKMILASSRPGDVVFDPFLGSGTTSVAAKKLKRRFLGIELDEEYACLAEKRLEMADRDSSIQGYSDGVFYERNTTSELKRTENVKGLKSKALGLFQDR